MKKVLCARDVECLVKEGQSTLYVESGTILTPSAKDAASAAGVEVVMGSAPQECSKPVPVAACDEGISSELIYSALLVLHEQGMLTTFINGLREKGIYLHSPAA
ncbi:hypothetical protein [Halodesulfovibrio spirochaetisodalis]|uniref:hypothetical protein n=1 Tax=Halodesulfovibrio spirochaetisodalis TaxID=1560234 RepID=UPI00082CA9B5|nr:hypothetical protein [Halodesulfovibrio spirochaetisodalis]